MSSHTVIWKYSSDGARPCGGDALLGWQLLESHGGAFRRYEAGPVDKLAATAIATVAIGNNVTIGAHGAVDPAAMALDELEELLCGLRPQVLVCPERPITNERREVERWCISYDGDVPASLPTAAIKDELARLVTKLFPRWIPRDAASTWTPTCLMVRPHVSAEQLGMVEPIPLVGDALLNAILADDAAAAAAYRAEDAGIPESSYRLASALLAAYERRGTPPEQWIFMRSGQAEDFLGAILLGMEDDLTFIDRSEGAGGRRIPVLAELRRRLKRYRELADTVLGSLLDHYSHPHPLLEKLRESARATAAAA